MLHFIKMDQNRNATNGIWRESSFESAVKWKMFKFILQHKNKVWFWNRCWNWHRIETFGMEPGPTALVLSSVSVRQLTWGSCFIWATSFCRATEKEPVTNTAASLTPAVQSWELQQGGGVAKVKTKLIIYPQLSKCVFGDVNKGSDAYVPEEQGDSSPVWKKGGTGTEGFAEICLLGFYFIFFIFYFKLPTVTFLSCWPLFRRPWDHKSLSL